MTRFFAFLWREWVRGCWARKKAACRATRQFIREELGNEAEYREVVAEIRRYRARQAAMRRESQR